MTNRLDETTLPQLLDELAGPAPGPLDHGRLQERGGRRRRTRQLAAGGASLSVLAAVALTLPTVLPTNDAPLVGTGPDAQEVTEEDDAAVIEIAGDGCPEPIAAAWTCLEPDARPAAPEPDLEALDNGSFELASIRGEVAVLTFWADWCSPCEAQQADIGRVSEGESGIAFVALALETQTDDAARYAQTHSIADPVLLDLEGRYLRDLNDTLSNELSDASQTAIPATYILDREGRIAAWSIGQTNESALLSAIEHASE
jgi:peroxiredoxin